MTVRDSEFAAVALLVFASAQGFVVSEPGFGGWDVEPIPAPPGLPLPVEQFYEFQSLDHFDGSNFQYWKQRYFMNNVTYRPGGPVFLMLGGQSAANSVWLVTGAWYEYAREHGAFMVLLEHRFFGESTPTDNITSSSLRFLSSRQALADNAQFIADLKRWYQHPIQDSKVIVFGGGYSGSLAAWMRSHYPYIVDGAVASSAPIFATLDFTEYYVAVTNTLASVNPACPIAIKNATSTMYEWWGQPDKRIIMQKIFRLCDKINHDALLDLTVFFYNLAENFARVVQFNGLDLQFLGLKNNNLTIEQVCDVMTDESRGDSVHRYAAVNSMVLDSIGQECTNFQYTKLITSLNQINWGSESAKGGRQRLYQICGEFGWARTSESSKQPFGNFWTFPWNFTTDQCADVICHTWGGSQVQDKCDQTNRFYGGLELPISNVVFVNGALDPWRVVSSNGTLPNAYGDHESILIEGTAHCADMMPPKMTDPPGLVDARKKISEHIGLWIK
ncbi:putative serine protease F56F10.1 isoform X1 [Dreissena polymorpha]|uniref:putative serine protease F56F10.1 isoform X1 n=1 Tax=Dreissena polymorpha TaxID=45954 RepID=UPI002263D549|nr:putative serine protease F56F10.1 isoform X1 [Dreissena polymorpha]